MKDIEKMFSTADFSKHGTLKEDLARKLFISGSLNKIADFPFSSISDSEILFVNAAQGIICQEGFPVVSE